MEVALILNNIRSNENVGSIFRTADAANVNKIYICGYTPAPFDRFERPNRALRKASLGAEKSVEWKRVKSFKKIAGELKEEGYTVIAIEQDKNSIDFRDLRKKIKNNKIAFVLGNEVKGISKSDLSVCNAVVEIPMKGKKESLNVSVTAGIILFQTLD